jgi:hypothetical protein
MTTMIIKDSSPQAKQFIKFARMLPFTTVIKAKKNGKSFEDKCSAVVSEFKSALQETKTMSADIAKNGTSGYKTLDDLLNED